MKNKFIHAIKAAFPQTVPVLFGYLFLGIAFGVLLQGIGYGPVWAFFMSLTIFAGTGQFLAVELISAHAGLISVAILTFLLNFRHFFYGISMIVRYHDVGKIKSYLIFGMTDETYAIITATTPPEGITKRDYYFAVTLLDHCYWIMGSVIGASIGGILPFDTTGIDFAMTALFAVLVVEQWKANKNHVPAMLGALVTAICLIVLGPDNFLIPALVILCALLLAFQKKLDMSDDNTSIEKK